MRISLIVSLLVTLGLAGWLQTPMPAAEQTRSKSTLEADPTRWIDLFSGKDLKGWKRVPIPPDEKLTAKNAWGVDAKTRTLLCDGVDVKEMLLYEHELADGIFHVEWRFRPVESKPSYNSGVYVRTTPDAKVWYQAQVAHVPQPPFLGDLFYEKPVNGKPERVVIRGEGDKRANPVGEWNTYEVTCQGKKISVWINGAVTTTWNDCPTPKGHVGLQAEFFFIEFRNLKFKELK